MNEVLEKRHAILVTEFDRYVIEHPEFAAKIPLNAQIILQVEGDEEYYKWSKQIAERQREAGSRLFISKFRALNLLNQDFLSQNLQ